MKTSLKIAALFGAASVVMGCNTFRGFGEDLQAAGSMISGKKDDRRQAPTSAGAPAPISSPGAAPAPAPVYTPAPAPQMPTQRR